MKQLFSLLQHTMTQLSFAGGLVVAVAAPNLLIPGFVALQTYRYVGEKVHPFAVNASGIPPSFTDGFWYGMGYVLGMFVMSYATGYQ
jgi:hypothetical protein